MSNFAHLRISTSSDLKSSIITPEKLKEKISVNNEYGNYFALSNRNNSIDNTTLFKVFEKDGQHKALIAVEIDLILKKTDNNNPDNIIERNRHSHLFIAKNYEGYKNLSKLQTILYTKNDSKNLEIDYQIFQQYGHLFGDDIYVLSGGLNSGTQEKRYSGSYLFQKFQEIYHIQNHIDNHQEKELKIKQLNDEVHNYLNFWKNVTKDNFFVEVQRQGTLLENEYIQYIIPIANKLEIPIVATHNVYFLDKKDYINHEVMLAYRGNYTRYSNQNQKRIINCTPENYLKTEREMQELFADIPMALENSIALAEDCVFDIRPNPGEFYLPTMTNDNVNETVEQMFIRIANDGLDKVLLNLFSLYADNHSPFNQNALQNLPIVEQNKYYLPDNAYFKKFQQWKQSGLSINNNSKEEILNYLKQTDLYLNEYKPRLDEEVDTINTLGFASYFLMVSDMIKYAKQHNIPVGIGRGSGAGSLVAYCMDITELDPLQFDLLFERFLNKERVSMPDFDIDFDKEKREEIFTYLSKKYNELGKRLPYKGENDAENPNFRKELEYFNKWLNTDSTARISTMSIFGYSSSIEVAATVLGNLNGNGALTKNIKAIIEGQENNLPFQNSIENDDELKDTEEISGNLIEKARNNQHSPYHYLIKYGKTFKDFCEYGESLFGTVRGFSSHAAGVVVSPLRLDELTPIMTDKHNTVLVQQNMKNAEYLGLIKYDILGLITLSYINSTLKEINKTRKLKDLPHLNIKDFLSQINIYDKNVYENIYININTENVFQFASDGFKNALKDIKPSCFEDLIAAVALFRPGPMDNIPEYARRKRGETPVIDLAPSNPAVAKILADTHGIMVYQEQIILIAQEYAGMTKGQADILRRAMGKKDNKVMQEQKDKFINNAIKTTAIRFLKNPQHQSHQIFKQLQNNPDSPQYQELINKEISIIHDDIFHEAENLFQKIEIFANYGFNKSHAAAYAKTSFITAWLKHYYPKEFTLGYINAMNNLDKKQEIPKTIQDGLKNNVQIRSVVNINESTDVYSLDKDDKIVPPLSIAIPNLQIVNKIILLRKNLPNQKFTSVQDFIQKCNQNQIKISKNDFIKILKSGAFNVFFSQHTHENYATVYANIDKILKQGEKYNQTPNFVDFLSKPLVKQLGYTTTHSSIKNIHYNQINRTDFPISQILANIYNTVNYFYDYKSTFKLLNRYLYNSSNPNNLGLGVFNFALNDDVLGLDSILRNKKVLNKTEKEIKKAAVSVIENWRKQFHSNSTNKEPPKFFIDNKKEILLTGLIIGYKEHKDFISLTIQFDGDDSSQSIGVIKNFICRGTNWKQTKFDLMTPYVFKLQSDFLRQYQPQITGDIVNEINNEEIQWRLSDCFSINNILKQLNHAERNDKNLPNFYFQYNTELLYSYQNDLKNNIIDEKMDFMTYQTKKIVQLMYDTYSLSQESIDKFQELLTLEDKDIIQMVNYNSEPLELLLPNNEKVTTYLNENLLKQLSNYNISIKLKVDPEDLYFDYDKNEYSLKTNALFPNLNIEKSVSLSNIQNNKIFQPIYPDLNLMEQDFLKSNQKEMFSGKALIYGTPLAFFTNKKTNSIFKIKFLLDNGDEIEINPSFGQVQMEELNLLQLSKPCVLKVDYYYDRKNQKEVFKLDDFYTENDIKTILPNNHYKIINTEQIDNLRTFLSKNKSELNLSISKISMNEKNINEHNIPNNQSVYIFIGENYNSFTEKNKPIEFTDNYFIKIQTPYLNKLLEQLNKNEIKLSNIYWFHNHFIQSLNHMIFPDIHSKNALNKDKCNFLHDGVISYQNNVYSSIKDNLIMPPKTQNIYNFQKISDFKHNCIQEFCNNHTGATQLSQKTNTLVSGVIVGVEEISFGNKGTQPFLIIADDTDYLRIPIKNNQVQGLERIKLQDYIQMDNKNIIPKHKGEILVFNMKVSFNKNNSAIYYDIEDVFTYPEIEQNLFSSYIVKVGLESMKTNIENILKNHNDLQKVNNQQYIVPLYCITQEQNVNNVHKLMNVPKEEDTLLIIKEILQEYSGCQILEQYHLNEISFHQNGLHHIDLKNQYIKDYKQKSIYEHQANNHYTKL